MKLPKNEFVILIILMVLISGISAAVYLYQINQPKEQERSTAAVGEQVQETREGEGEVLSPEEKELATERKLEDDLYSILIPEGWVQAVINSDKFLAMVIKPDSINPDNLADVDYNTYYAVNNARIEANGLDEYVDLLKQSLGEQIPSIEFTKQNYGAIGGHGSIYLESESKIEEKDYKTLLVFVEDGPWVWAISFNTLSDSWEENRGVFYQIADSLVIK